MVERRFSVKPGQQIPESWKANSWEEKARDNPLYAVMTTTEFVDAAPDAFTETQLDKFFDKGRIIFDTHVKPLISPSGDPYIVEYGCGMGRILKAVAAEKYRCSGVDISETMLKHCRDLAPEVSSLHLLNAANRSDLASQCADLVYSYAVLQHIQRLSDYLLALDEICRLLKPGGAFAIQVNCEDFVNGLHQADWTENFDDHSLHYRRGQAKPYRRHTQSTWSGVYIGAMRLRYELARRDCAIQRIYYHNPAKLRAIWVTGIKSADPSSQMRMRATAAAGAVQLALKCFRLARGTQKVAAKT
jgi:SAM-dependent methyltransferase